MVNDSSMLYTESRLKRERERGGGMESNFCDSVPHNQKTELSTDHLQECKEGLFKIKEKWGERGLYGIWIQGERRVGERDTNNW